MPDFFVLPLELRNQVYDELWKLNNCVAAYHKYTGSGILAYYDGMDLSMRRVEHTLEIHRINGIWCSSPGPDLPQWLLGNKQILREGMEQFRFKAVWNIWPVRSYEDVTPWKHKEDNMVMCPNYARSISLRQTGFRCENICGSVTEFILPGAIQAWLCRLIWTFEGA